MSSKTINRIASIAGVLVGVLVYLGLSWLFWSAFGKRQPYAEYALYIMTLAYGIESYKRLRRGDRDD